MPEIRNIMFASENYFGIARESLAAARQVINGSTTGQLGCRASRLLKKDWPRMDTDAHG